ncbi:methyltransferase domain-containing protein [Pseudonocardia sp.]|uniref:methyltransferase domain-containing protein n=1 Tax=Pseudonocardia sp. TaxID=60912 RepID=UPI00341F8C47
MTTDRATGHSAAIDTARTYYNSDDADTFYRTVWGGEDIHVGLYRDPGEDIATASRRTVERMAELAGIGPDDTVLDLGAGYGGAARHLARAHGSSVHCLNLSEVENERNREMTGEQGLADRISVTDGAFEELPFDDAAFDVVWSQDAFLHSADRTRVIEEATRVLRPGGRIVFTDPMAQVGVAPDALTPILDRIQLETMATPEFYLDTLAAAGANEITFEEHHEQLPTHYGRVLEELVDREQELAGSVSTGYLTRMKAGLRHWVDGGRAGNLAWGIFRATT